MFNFIEFKDPIELVLIYTGQYKSVGKFKRNVFCFKDEENKPFHIWAYVQLNNILYGVPFGTKIKLKYWGMDIMPDSNKPYKNFEIEILDPK